MWILVVEDEPSMRAALRQGLEEDNHTVALAGDGLEGMHAAETCDFDAMLLDVMMPGMDGIDLIRKLRAAGRHTPVLMLTARDAASDIVKGLDAGADDYLTKPFSFRVLLARLRAISRRSVQPPKSRLQVHDLLLDPASHQVSRAGIALSLTATEYRVVGLFEIRQFALALTVNAACASTCVGGFACGIIWRWHRLSSGGEHIARPVRRKGCSQIFLDFWDGGDW